MKVPAFLLRRLYVSGSLRNIGDGWAFTLRNSIASGEATSLYPLTLDGTVLDPERCFFHPGGEPVSFAAVGEGQAFGLESGRDITITVTGEPLAPGEHTVGMGFRVAAIGDLSFDFTDEVA
jgi:hypothetical protein